MAKKRKQKPVPLAVLVLDIEADLVEAGGLETVELPASTWNELVKLAKAEAPKWP